jgi:hypothetical protein
MVAPESLDAFMEANSLPDEPAVPEGWQTAPKEADYGMVQVGIESYKTENAFDRSLDGKIARIYADMLAAAPAPPAKGGWQ